MQFPFRLHPHRPLRAPVTMLILLTGILLSFAVRSLAAQSPATPAVPGWGGVLRSDAGLPLSGATVTLTGPSTLSTTTATDGSFRFLHPAPGAWTLAVRLPHRPATAAITVQIPGPAAALTLTVANSLSLAAAPLPANSTPDQASRDATGGEKLSSQAVSELPLNRRDFSTLLLLAAGTMTDANGATNFTQQFAINGQRGVEATFAMDGADISDPEMGGSTFTNFNVDAVEEIQSSSGWMPAEIGRGAAGFTNIVTRSGSSGFHGSFFEFLRNSALDARNYFDHPSIADPGRIPPFRRNEFGFTNGGPVVLPHLYDGRGRTFYFAQYQGFRQVLGTTQVLPVPTAAERAGHRHRHLSRRQHRHARQSPSIPQIAAVLARYPAAQQSHRRLRRAHLCRPRPRSITNADQFSLRIDQQARRKRASSSPASTTTTSPAPPPIPTRPPSIPPSASSTSTASATSWAPIPAPSRRTSPVESFAQHHAHHARLSHAQPH